MAKKKDQEADVVQEELAIVPPSAPVEPEQKDSAEPMYLIENTEPRIYGYPVVISEGPPRVLETRVLGPGISEISQAEFDEERKTNIVLKHALKAGQLVVRAKTDGSGLAGVPDKEANGVISQTFDLKLLKRWESFRNTSQKVSLAISQRIGFVTDELRKRGEEEAA